MAFDMRPDVRGYVRVAEYRRGTIVMNPPSARSTTAATPMATEAATPSETVSTEPYDAMSDMLPEIVAIIHVVEIPVMVEEVGTANAKTERIIDRIGRVFGVPVIGIGVVV
jgi:hypothetical protein